MKSILERIRKYVGSAGRRKPSTLIRARSSSLAIPMIRAVMVRPLPASAVASVPSALSAGSTTSTRWAPFTTCAFVMMKPSGSMMNPEPVLRALAMTTLPSPRPPCAV